MGETGQKGDKPGYEYLIAYQQSLAIEELVDRFCEVYWRRINSRRRTEHMTDSARSMAQNIAEGYTRKGLKDYIDFVSFSRASGEELLKDLFRLAKKWGVEVKRETRDQGVKGEKRAIPFDPSNPSIPISYLINLVKRTNYLIDRLHASLEQKFIKEGGYTEKLAKKRREFRGY